MKSMLTCFPEAIPNASGAPPGSYDFEKDNKFEIDIAVELIEKSKIGLIDADIEGIVEQSRKESLNITQYGFETISVSSIETCFSEAEDQRIVKDLQTGNKYICIYALWIKGIKFKCSIDQTNAKKLGAILGEKKSELLEGGINIESTSTETFDMSFSYDEKFFPFCKFARIRKNGEILALDTGLLIDEEGVDLGELNYVTIDEASSPAM